MATMITSECINCGACEPECPNTAIYQGGVEWQAPDGGVHAALSNDIFYIVPEKCTECVGFHDQEACAAVCPVDCCVPNPDIPETQDVLLARARVLHPEESIPDDAPSRFRKDGATEAAPAAVPAGGAPAAVSAAARPAAAPAKLVVVSRRVEKAVGASPAKPRPAQAFRGELPVEFDQLLAQLGAPRRRARSLPGRVGLPLLAVGQGLLGALSASTKQRLEEGVSNPRFFSAALATAANVFLNLVLYPIVCLALAVDSGKVSLFTEGVQRWIVLGLSVAVAEAAWRLRENFFRGIPFGEAPLRGALYGPLVAPLGWVVRLLVGDRGAESTASFDGFSSGGDHFDSKLERDRRYGSVYRLEDRDDAYILRMEFPRVLPPSSLADALRLPPDMPDYDYDLALRDGTFVVHGRVTDPQVRKLTGVAPAFPSEFTAQVPLGARVSGFRHRYRDKTLEVILVKAAS